MITLRVVPRGYRAAMDVRFTGTCLISVDVASLAAFYAGVLGAGVRGDDTFATVATPGANLSVYSAAGMEQMAPGSMTGAGSGNFTLEFEVGDVDACHERVLAHGLPILKPPTTQPWGRRSVWLRDPDGNVVNLYQPLPAPPQPATVVAEYFRRLLVERDLSACDDLLAEDYLDHDAPAGTEPGPRATRAYVADMLADYPDLRFAIEDTVTLDHHVTVRATWRGTHRETGVRLEQTGLVLLRVDGSGRLAERRSAYAGASRSAQRAGDSRTG
jgi:catechol 2,3-dioxygenase-like lactoylglutathione lyase family enzyme